MREETRNWILMGFSNVEFKKKRGHVRRAESKMFSVSMEEAFEHKVLLGRVCDKRT